MRNLKKLLSMLLVVAMIVSLCAVGSFSAAAAEYSETTNYKEAAAVVSGIGIINGYEDGTMQYDKAVTREEAAKIICVALIGTDTVANLKTAAAPFDDVAANRWSAPYIAYLKSLGIVNGKTATEFDPTAEVTGVEFAKMLLCAAGYGKAGEFVGASWDVNTITTANTNGIFENTKALDITAAATREECMLYAFNAITRVPVVNFNTTFQTYYTGNSVMNGTVNKVLDANVGDATKDDYQYTLAYTKFKLVKAAGIGNTDAYGRPATAWSIEGGKRITDAVATKAPAAVINNGVNSMSLAMNLGADVVSSINKYVGVNGKAIATTDARIAYYVDGVRTAIDMFSPIKGNEMFANSHAKAGSVTEIYVDTNATGEYCLTFVVINQYFAKVTKVDAANKKLYVTAYNSFNNTDTKMTNCVVDGEKVDISGFAKNDYVLVTLENTAAALANGSNVTSIVKANSAVGTYKGTDGIGLYVVDDQSLNATSKICKDIVTWTVNMGNWSSKLNLEIGNSYTFYYDTLGNIAYIELYDAAETSAVNYLYIPDDKVTAHDDDWDNSITAFAQIRGVFPEGGYKDFYLPVKTENSKNYVAITNGASVYKYRLDTEIASFKTATKGKFFAYTTNEDGTVNLKALNNKIANVGTVPMTGNVINKGLATVTGVAPGYTANSKTVLTVINASGEVKTYTGIANFPQLTLTAGSPVLYTYAINSKTIKTICYVDDDATVAGKTLAYCAGPAGTDAKGATYNFYLNGEKTPVTFDLGTELTTGAIYDLTLSTSGNSATLQGYANGVVNDNGGAGTVARRTLGKLNFGSFAYEPYYAWTLIKNVDSNTFTTESVEAGEIDNAIYNPYALGMFEEDGVTPLTEIASYTYYYDGNTKIYDCRFGANGVAAELSEGVAFVAHVDTASGGIYNGVDYCDYIWIIG